jgi:hypothetical protein
VLLSVAAAIACRLVAGTLAHDKINAPCASTEVISGVRMPRFIDDERNSARPRAVPGYENR